MKPIIYYISKPLKKRGNIDSGIYESCITRHNLEYAPYSEQETGKEVVQYRKLF